jgi:hypothetical protein
MKVLACPVSSIISTTVEIGPCDRGQNRTGPKHRE